jgi:lipid A ethanolaminephosphotransferase
VLAPLSTRWTAKPLLALMIVVSAFASYYIQQYGVYLDPTMLRNVLRTDPHEAGELLSLSLALHLLLYAVLPLLVLWRVRLALWPWKRSLLTRLGLVPPALAVLVATLLAVFQPFSSLMRNQKELRYLITPANCCGRWPAWPAPMPRPAVPRKAIGLDARPGPSGPRSTRPRLLVLVVGETARAANWGLSGYARQTTPAAGHAAGVNFSTRSAAAPTPRPRCPACSPRSAGATTTKPPSAAASRCCTCWRGPASA